MGAWEREVEGECFCVCWMIDPKSYLTVWITLCYHVVIPYPGVLHQVVSSITDSGLALSFALHYVLWFGGSLE